MHLSGQTPCHPDTKDPPVFYSLNALWVHCQLVDTQPWSEIFVQIHVSCMSFALRPGGVGTDICERTFRTRMTAAAAPQTTVGDLRLARRVVGSKIHFLSEAFRPSATETTNTPLQTHLEPPECLICSTEILQALKSAKVLHCKSMNY